MFLLKKRSWANQILKENSKWASRGGSWSFVSWCRERLKEDRSHRRQRYRGNQPVDWGKDGVDNAERRRGEREKRKGNTQSFQGTPGFPVHTQGYEKLLFSWSHYYESLLHADKRTYWKEWTLASNFKSKHVPHFPYSYVRPNTCQMSWHRPLGEYGQINLNT